MCKYHVTDTLKNKKKKNEENGDKQYTCKVFVINNVDNQNPRNIL